MTENISSIQADPSIPKGTYRRKKKRNKNSHVDIFLNNYSNILSLFPVNKCKEISESMSAHDCLYYIIGVNRSSPDTYCYVLGDGTSPRTAALIAISSKFKVFSIDPLLTSRWNNYMDRLTLFTGLSQDFTDINPKASLSIIIGVHSHANLNEFWSRVPKPKIAISIPCCVKQETSIDITGKYIDPKNLSEKNTVLYWLDL